MSPGEYLQKHGTVIVGGDEPCDIGVVYDALFKGRLVPVSVIRECTWEEYKAQAPNEIHETYAHYYEITTD